MFRSVRTPSIAGPGALSCTSTCRKKAALMEPWIVGSKPSARYPLWTRANVGEVFPDPVAPLTFTVGMRVDAEGSFRDASVKMGAFTHDEFAPDNMEVLGVFGAYCYLN